jgi:hypothetical protein
MLGVISSVLLMSPTVALWLMSLLAGGHSAWNAGRALCGAGHDMPCPYRYMVPRMRPGFFDHAFSFFLELGGPSHHVVHLLKD